MSRCDSNPGTSWFSLLSPSPPRTGRGQGSGAGERRRSAPPARQHHWTLVLEWEFLRCASSRYLVDAVRRSLSTSTILFALAGEKAAQGRMRCPGRVGRAGEAGTAVWIGSGRTPSGIFWSLRPTWDFFGRPFHRASTVVLRLYVSCCGSIPLVGAGK